MSDEPAIDAWSEGDAGLHLEELVVDALPALQPTAHVGRTADIELVGAHLRMTGTLSVGQFRRVSDFLNNHFGLITIRDATVLRRNGTPTRVTTPSFWIAPAEITLVAIHAESQRADDSMVGPRTPRTLIVVTPGHTLTGTVHLPVEAQLSTFIESPDPTFLALTDVRTRSLADRRIITRYDVAMLNRGHVVAVTELQPGMIVGRAVL